MIRRWLLRFRHLGRERAAGQACQRRIRNTFAEGGTHERAQLAHTPAPIGRARLQSGGPYVARERTPAALSATRASTHQRIVVGHDRARCGDADFTSIQAAVDAANPGETILVCPGTYNEWVVITKDDLRLLAKGKRGDVDHAATHEIEPATP